MEDYKVRFVEEYTQLKDRYKKLKNYINKIEVAQYMGTEEPPHDVPVDMLRDQLNYMGYYMNILEKRAIIEKVELEA